MSILTSKPVHTISVRDLVEFVLRAGDLGGEREFVGSDRALAGIRGHQKIQNLRPTGYLTELPVEYRVETDKFTLHILSDTDCGVVLLIDARFNETRYRRLFPAWWKYLRVRHTEGSWETVGNFWKTMSG